MSSSKNNPHGLVTGQTLYYVPFNGSRRESAGDVVVTSVGRKWATIGSGGRRIALDTLIADGASYIKPGRCYLTYIKPGRCYLSRDAYVADVLLRDAWRALRYLVDRGGMMPPDGVTVERIKQAAELLGLIWGE